MDNIDIVYEILLKCNIDVIEKMIICHDISYTVCKQKHFWDNYNKEFCNYIILLNLFDYPKHIIHLYKIHYLCNKLSTHNYIFQKGHHEREIFSKVKLFLNKRKNHNYKLILNKTKQMSYYGEYLLILKIIDQKKYCSDDFIINISFSNSFISFHTIDHTLLTAYAYTYKTNYELNYKFLLLLYNNKIIHIL
jgi:hypothetical protein